MAKICFFNVPGHGHVNPTLPVTKALAASGHEFIYYNTPEFREKVERTGADFRPYPSPNISATELATMVSNLVNVTLRLFSESERLLPFVLTELRREQPDLVIFDSIALWGMQAAHLLDLPSAASISTFVQEGTERTLTWRDWAHILGHALPAVPRLIARRRRLVNEYGSQVFPHRHVFPCTGDLNIVYTSREFQPETAFLDDSFHFVGPSLDAATREATAFPWEQLDSQRPTLYLSLGTIHRNRDLIQEAFHAFEGYPVQVIVAAGRGTDLASPGKVPSNFIVRPFVPQLELLRRVDLFISHGGMNSVNEALYEGVPLLVVPQQMEQLLNGRQVARHGAGLVLGDRPPYGRVDAGQLRQAVERLFADDGYRRNAERIGRSFRAAGGYQEAVKLLQNKIGQPVEHFQR